MSKMINEATFSWDKSPECEDNLPQSMVEVKNAWKYPILDVPLYSNDKLCAGKLYLLLLSKESHMIV
jgi:hypothetical protein